MYINNIKQTNVGNDSVLLEVPCPFCGKTTKLTLKAKTWFDGLKAYNAGALAQNAWPTLSPDERELFISGICSKCWDNL